MLEVILSNQFKRDLRLAAKRGYDLDLLDEIVNKLASKEELPEKNRDHNLTGKYAGFRECHIQPDWLLVYRTDETALILFFQTGTHADCSNARNRPCYE